MGGHTVVGNIIAFPFYWYINIWKDRPVPADCGPDFIPDTVYCPKCGAVNDFNNYRCATCSFVMHPLPCERPKPANGYSSIGVIVPYKNTYALTAYYLAVFSLIPAVGLILGLTALALGIKGRRYYLEHPEAKGIAHAWVGILLGGLTGVANIAGLYSDAGTVDRI